MKEYSTKCFVGIDLGDRENEVCVLDRNGDIVRTTTIDNTAEGINAFFDRFDRPRDVLVAVEAGSHSPWISELLENRGFQVLVGNPRKLRAIWGSSNKRDQRDAEMLARIARFDTRLLYPIEHRSRVAHTDLALLKSRDTLVQCRTKLINFLRGSCKTAGARLPSCSAESFPKAVMNHIPKELLPAALPCLHTILELTQKIRQMDRQIERLCKETYTETSVFRDIDGVGPLTSLGYVLTLEHPDRFKKSRDVGPYLGLTPKRDQSGETDKPLSISKEGNKYLRRLLVGSAHYILGPFGPDCHLRRYGLRIASRGGKVAKRRAVVAVARKLAVMMHHIWKNNTRYDPFYQSHPKAKAA